MKKIPLINGGFTIVDDEDYDFLSQFKWRRDKTGYAQRTTRKPYGVHRFMHRIVAQTPPGMLTDHINHHKLDNRRANLRVCTTSQNSYNKRDSRNNKHGLKGVCYCRQTGKWKAYVTQNGKQQWLGRFTELKDAVHARDVAVAQLRGEYSVRNNTGRDVLDAMCGHAKQYRVTLARNRALAKSNKSGYRGVSWSRQKRKWRATIGVDGQHLQIAIGDDPEELAYLYDQFALQLFGEECYLNLL